MMLDQVRRGEECCTPELVQVVCDQQLALVLL